MVTKWREVVPRRREVHLHRTTKLKLQVGRVQPILVRFIISEIIRF